MTNKKDLSILFGRQFNGVGHCGTYKREDFRLYFWGHNQTPLVLIIPHDGDIAFVDMFKQVQCLSTDECHYVTFGVYRLMGSWISEVEMFNGYANIVFSNNSDLDYANATNKDEDFSLGQREVAVIQIMGDYRVISVEDEE
jgi:hypothetical protein